MLRVKLKLWASIEEGSTQHSISFSNILIAELLCVDRCLQSIASEILQEGSYPLELQCFNNNSMFLNPKSRTSKIIVEKNVRPKRVCVSYVIKLSVSSSLQQQKKFSRCVVWITLACHTDHI